MLSSGHTAIVVLPSPRPRPRPRPPEHIMIEETFAQDLGPPPRPHSTARRASIGRRPITRRHRPTGRPPKNHGAYVAPAHAPAGPVVPEGCRSIRELVTGSGRGAARCRTHRPRSWRAR